MRAQQVLTMFDQVAVQVFTLPKRSFDLPTGTNFVWRLPFLSSHLTTPQPRTPGGETAAGARPQQRRLLGSPGLLRLTAAVTALSSKAVAHRIYLAGPGSVLPITGADQNHMARPAF